MMTTSPAANSLRALGSLTAEHRPRPGPLRTNRLLAWAGTLGGSFALALGLWRWAFAYSTYGPALVWRWSLPWLLVGVPLLLVGLASLAWMLRWGVVTVRVYSRGMRYTRGGRELILPWSEILHVFASAVRYGMHRWVWSSRADVTVVADGNRQIRLSHTLQDLATLLETIKRHVYPRLLADYTRRFRSGERLTFGPLELGKEGISKGARMIKWEDLDSVGMDQGKIALRSVGGRGARSLRVPARAVPNVEICLQLIQHLIPAK